MAKRSHVGEGNEVIQVVVPVEVAAEVERLAERFGTSKSKVGRGLIEAGLENFYMYDKYIMKPESAVRIAVAVDGICQFLRLPRVFGTTDEEAKFLDSMKRERQAIQNELVEDV